jgi:hypothetical protein
MRLEELLRQICPNNNYNIILDNRHFYDWKKPYLSYIKGEGWSLKYLNIFERIFRCLFNFYPQTHFCHIAEHISEETCLNNRFLQRMHTCWEKAYPDITCPFSYVPPMAVFFSDFDEPDESSSSLPHDIPLATQEIIIDLIDKGHTTPEIIEKLKNTQIINLTSLKNWIDLIGLIIDLNNQFYEEQSIIAMLEESYSKETLQTLLNLIKQQKSA